MEREDLGPWDERRTAMNPRRTGVALILGAALLLVAAACGEEATPAGGGGGGGGQGEETEGSGTIMVAGEEATDHGTVDVAGMSSTEMEMDDFYFEPTVLTGDAGQSLTIELTNEGSLRHTFTIDSQSVDVNLGGGESGTADVTFPDSGALLFYCQFHAGNGMRGGLSMGGDLEAATTGGSGGGGGSGSGGGGGGGGGYPGYG
jgi:plastocyanin